MASSTTKIEIKSPCLILVEGQDDKRFISQNLRFVNIDEGRCQVEPIGGKDSLRNRLEALVISPEFVTVERLALLRDADTNAESAFQSCAGAIRAAQLDPPNSIGAFSEGTPRVGVFILPGYSRSGELEDLLLDSIEGCKRTGLAQEYLSRVKSAGLPTDKDSKAVVYSYLACQERSGLRIGEATEKGYFPLNSPAFRPLQDFLKEFASGT